MDFKGKIALVTGAAKGIGREAALGFAKGGAKVMCVDKDATGAAAIAKEIGGEARSFAADVTKAADVAAYVKATTDAFGRIDCFFNNAGVIGKVAHVVEYDESDFDLIIDTNVKGVFLGLRHVLPVMLKQKGGSIVNTGSVAGLVGTPGMPIYVASKHAVLGMTKSVAGEVARQGIRVNAVCPGPVETDMIRSVHHQLSANDPSSVEQRYRAAQPTGRYTRPDEVATLVLFLASDLAANITGAHYVIDGGRTAVGGAVTTVQGS